MNFRCICLLYEHHSGISALAHIPLLLFSFYFSFNMYGPIYHGGKTPFFPSSQVISLITNQQHGQKAAMLIISKTSRLGNG